MADLTKFSVKELSEFLSDKGFDEDVIQLLQNEKVDGETFTDTTAQDLKDMSVKFGDRRRLLKLIQQHCDSQQQSLEPPAPPHSSQTKESEDTSQRPDVATVCSFKTISMYLLSLIHISEPTRPY